jgi:hypothetical protein
MSKKISIKTILVASIMGTTTLIANTAKADLAPNIEMLEKQEWLMAVQFQAPNDKVPKTSVGGGVRGEVQFAMPEQASAPKSTVGGGVRGEVQFAMPGQASAPKSTVGGGVRGEVQFAMPGQASAPKSTVGGGVRGEVQFAMPGQASTPKSTVGGGVRGEVKYVIPHQAFQPQDNLGEIGEIENLEIPLTALLPATKYGRTAAVRPTIFAYLPPIGAQIVFFSIQNEEGNSHYYTILPVPTEGGVISFTLPESAPELELGKNYLWYFAPIEPGGVLRPDNYAVTGWITRVDTNFNQPELASSPIKLATEYARAGIWYDTLQVLAQAQYSDPDNKILASEWHDLLEQIELEEIASQPIAMLSLF